MNDDSFSLLSERFNATPQTDTPAEAPIENQAPDQTPLQTPLQTPFQAQLQADDSFALIAPQAPEI